MSKLSFLVLVIGLFFLSSLLFITGFLMAVNVYDIKPPQVTAAGAMSTPNANFVNTAPTIPTINMQNAGVSNVIPNASIPSVSLQIQQGTTSQSTAPQQANFPASNNAMPGVQAADPATVRMPTAYAQLPTQLLPPAPAPSMPVNGTPYVPQETIMPKQPIQQHVQQVGTQHAVQQTAPQTYQAQQPYTVQQQPQVYPAQQPYQPPSPPQQYYPSQQAVYSTYVQPNYHPNS
ncbi:MAG: hypothetical protein Q8S21_02565 [Candidatus Paracaedibacteraceae bacterium]|nr:hypothetical protein [Candidatus Paracaedibacteraceae bacterium]